MSGFIRVKNFLFPLRDIRAISVKDNIVYVVPTRPYKGAEYLSGDNCKFYRNRSEIEFDSEQDAKIAFNYLMEDMSHYE